MKLNRMFVCLALVISSFATLTLPSFADGDDSAIITKKMTLEETTIEQDFENLKNVEGNSFDEADYPVIEGEDPRLLTLVEDCKLPSTYSIYLYIYNPGLYDIRWRGEETVQLSFDGNTYNKHSLEFIDSTDDGRFLKAKVFVPNSFWRYLNEKQHSVYFSGFELNVKTGSEPVLREYSNFENFDNFAGDSNKSVQLIYEGNNPSRLVNAIGIDALRLKLNMTYYRATNENSGDGEMNQLITAYFTIPKSYFRKYGNITDIHLSYRKYENVPAFVSKNDVFKFGVDHHVFYPLIYYSGSFYQQGIIDTLGVYAKSDLSLVVSKLRPVMDSLITDSDYYRIQDNFDFVPDDLNNYHVLYSGDDVTSHNVPIFQDENCKVSSEVLSGYFAKHPEMLKNEKKYNYSVSDTNIDDFLHSDSYISSTNFFERFIDLGFGAFRNFEDDSFDVSPYAFVDEKDVDLADDEFSKKYKIELSEVLKVKQALNRAMLKGENGDRVVLLRLDVSQVSETPLFFAAYLKAKDIGKPLVWKTGYSVSYNQEVIYTTNTVYQNVDVLDITYRNNQEKYVIPVVSDPVHTYVPPTLTPGDVNDKLFGSPNKVSYWGLVILAVTVFIAVTVVPAAAPAIGHFLGEPVDKLIKKNKEKRKSKKQRK